MGEYHYRVGRLELSYPHKHKLMIEDKADRYHVKLNLTID
jgi:hypothetical protein